ncbi:MAG: hypothetical protein IJ667_03265 [Synergistaceae bacterium]|nr:hypothetical protein [Synergistaceae bacterium]
MSIVFIKKFYAALSLILLFAAAAFAVTTSYTSTQSMEHALELIDGTAQSHADITVMKTGDASGSSSGSEYYDWYGGNAAVFASNQSNLTISNATITTNATYSAGVFSYGGYATQSGSTDNTTINILNSTINTSKQNSGGIMVTGGGILNATNLTVTTQAGSSAAIRSDSRGGGTITVNGGTYTANGQGSPAIYSTADITATNAILKSGVAQAVVIEGKNTVTLNNCTVNANNTTHNGQDTTYSGVFLYQSMSGDSSTGTSTFTMSKGSLTNANGDVFLITNTNAIINLTGVAITNNDTANNGYFLRAAAQNWGTSGSNGGNVTLNASGQTIKGDIYVDRSSSLTLNLKDGSTFTGAITNQAAKSAVVTVEAGSTWTVTDDTYVTSLTNNGTVNASNGASLYVAGTEYELEEADTDTDTGTDTDTDTDVDSGDNDADSDTGSSDDDYSYYDDDDYYTDLESINGGVTVTADKKGNYSKLPKGSVVRSVRSVYEDVLDVLIAQDQDTSSVVNSSKKAKNITAQLDKALPYGSIVLLAFDPVTTKTVRDPYYAAILHSGKAGDSSRNLVINTSKLYNPADTSKRVTFPSGTYTIAFATLDAISSISSVNTTGIAVSSQASASSGQLADQSFKQAAMAGTWGNLGDIKLASTKGSGGGSSGCSAGFGLLGLAALLMIAKIKK